MPNVIGEMVVKVGVDTLGLDKGLAQGQNKMQGFATGIGKMGKAMMMGFTLPIAAAGVAVTKMAMDFESQMTDVYTLMDEAQIQSRDWGKAVLDLSEEVGQSSATMSKALYNIVSSGFAGADALNVLKVSSKAAAAGLADTGESVGAITAVLNAYNLSADQAEHVSDILFTTVKYGVTTFPELASSVGRVISTAAAANVSFDEVGAALAQMTLGGISTEEAVTALNQVILNFLSPTDQAAAAAARVGFKLNAVTLSTKGLGGAMAELIEKLGISAEELTELEKQGYSDEEMWDELAVKTGISAEIFAEIFSNVRALKGALSLASGEGKRYTEMQDRMADSSGKMAEAFNKQAQTAKFQFSQAKEAIKAAAIELGTTFLPIAIKAFNTVGDLANRFADMDKATQDSMLSWAAMLAIVPLVLVGFSKIITSAIAVKAALSGITLGMAGISMLANFATGLIGVGTAAGSMVTAGVPALGWFSDVIGLTKTASGEFGKAMNLMKKVAFKSQCDIIGEFGKRGPAGGKNWIQLYTGEIQTLITELEKTTPRVQAEALKMFDAFRESPQAEEDVLALKTALEGLDRTAADFGGNMQDSTDSIMAFRYQNTELIDTFSQLNTEFNQGLIGPVEYKKAIDYLVASNGSYKGSLQELYVELGLMTSEQAGLTETVPPATQVLSDQLDVVVDLKGSFDDLLNTLFQLYNLNQSVTETGWAYQDSLTALDEVLKNHSATEREVQEAIFGVQNAREDHIKSILSEMTAEGISAEKRQGLINLYVQLGLSAIEAGETSSEEFLKIAKAAGITKTGLTTAIEEIGTSVDNLPKEIKAQVVVEKTQAETDMAGIMAIYGTYEESNPETTITADIEPGKTGLEKLEQKMLEYERSHPETKIYADTSPAWKAMNALSQYVIPAKTIPVKYGIPGFAHGGEVPGPAGVPRPAIVHGGEWVVNPFEPKSVNQFVNAMGGEKTPQPSTIINKFDIATLMVREDADVTKIARELLDMQKQEQRSLGK